MPFYAQLKKRLSAHGLVVVQSTSPYFAPHAYWCVDATLRAAGFETYPYHTYVPSFGEWGFILANTGGGFTPPTHYRLPMRYIDRLPEIYEIAQRFVAAAAGRSNLYVVLLDYRDSRAEPYGLYVGMSRYAPAERFDQHKAGIRSAGSVRRRGLEVLVGPTLHLQRIRRSDAARIEVELAEAYAAAGFFVQGGH